jgi:molybdopterin/thiamine biosynthesis adenylyltransferase
LSEEDFRPIIAAVAQDGFEPHLVGRGIELRGEIQVLKRKVPLTIRFDDLTLAEGPRLLVPDLSMLDRKVMPHVDEAGELCAVDRRLFVFDRHRAPEQARGLIVRATEVLERGMTRKATEDIAEEFGAYWAVSVPTIETSDQDNPDPQRPRNEAVVTTTATLSFAPHQARPATLGELIDWSNHWDSKLGPKILNALARLNAQNPTIEIHAKNATVGATILVLPALQKSLARQAGWARFIRIGSARALPILRTRRRRLNLAELFGANGPEGRAPLAGKRVVVIGCGAIGGYLARMLAQLGAGLQARLILIDREMLSYPNIRRHQLGISGSLRNKAEALAEAIILDFPGLEVEGVNGDATDRLSMLASADLVIDATGEQGLSEWLNDWAIGRRAAGESVPALQFVWVVGAGAAAQSLFVVDDKYACYRCLQPDPTKPGRFDPLKHAPPEPVAACGDEPTMLYGPAAPASAASLAAAHASDWASGHPHALLRTVRIDWSATTKRDPKSPDRAENCPACKGR